MMRPLKSARLSVSGAHSSTFRPKAGLVTVYLDSADYSNLSNPRSAKDNARTRDELRELARDDRVAFCFSSVALFESSPLKAQDGAFAAARIALAGELCGSNALVSIDRVFDMEAKQIQQLSVVPEGILRSDGHWFPDVSDLVPPLGGMRSQLKCLMEEQVSSMNLNRAQRRAVAARTSRKGMLRTDVLTGLTPASELELARLPLRQKDAVVIQRYMAGGATRDAAELALLSSLADLTTLAGWIRDGNDMSLKLAAILRQPAEKFIASAQEGLGLAMSARKAALAINPQLDREIGWSSLRANMLREFITKQACDCGDPPERSIEEFEEFCPGMSTAMTMLFLQIKKAVQGGRPPLVASDFADCLHTVYAPYVSIFRADKRTAPDVAPILARWGTTTTRRVEQVPGLIKARLKSEV